MGHPVFSGKAKVNAWIKELVSGNFRVCCVNQQKCAVHQESVLSPLHFATAVDVISENARERLMNKILNVIDLVLMSESMENLKEKFLKWNGAFESKRLKVNLKKSKVMISSSKDEILKSKVDPCAKCSKRMMANSVMCTKCGKWVCIVDVRK